MVYKKHRIVIELVTVLALVFMLVWAPVLSVQAADYSSGGCVKWARYRTAQVYGFTLPSTTNQPSGVYGASNWWYSLPSKYPRGQVPEANCLAIWSGGSASYPNYGHVAYVESVNSDGSLTLTEGGFSSSTYTDTVTGELHTGVRNSTVITMDRNNYTFLGYVYLDGTAPTVSESESETDNSASGKKMYRLYNPNSGEHFYTLDNSEATYLDYVGWEYEGVAWIAPTTGNPVYRLYNPNDGDHHYTMSYEEAIWLDGLGWTYEGVAWYSDVNQTTVIYRLYNPNSTGAGSHHFTMDYSEAMYLDSVGWNYEGTAWYGL